MSWKDILKEVSDLEREIAREYAPREMEEGKFEAEGLKEDRELKEYSLEALNDFYNNYLDDLKKILDLLQRFKDDPKFKSKDYSALPLLKELFESILSYKTKIDELYGYEMEYLFYASTRLMGMVGGMALKHPSRFLGELKNSGVIAYAAKYGDEGLNSRYMEGDIKERINTLRNIITLGQDISRRRKGYPTRKVPLKL